MNQGDSLAVGDRVLQYGLVGVARRERLLWSPPDDAGTITVSGTYRGSPWSADVEELYLPTQVAHPFFPMPLQWTRMETVGVRDTVYVEAFLDSASIRLHETPDWEPDRNVAVVRVQGAAHEGTIETVERASRSARWLEIRHRYQSRRAVLNPDEYNHRHRDYLLYEALAQQNYRYRRRIAKVRQNAPTAMEAAARILGPDGGGAGSSGPARRKAARDLLARTLRTRAPGARAYVLLAQAAVAERRYHVADSLVAIARSMDPKDRDVLDLHAELRGDLGDRAGRLAALRERLSIAPDSAVLLDLLVHLYRTGRDAEAESLKAANRTKSLVEHTLPLAGARVGGYVAGFRCREARAAFAAYQPENSADRLGTESALCMTCGPLDRAVKILEPMVEEDPGLTRLANDLAWAYVRLGLHLDRAADLVAIGTLLEPNNPFIRNTQAALELRQGKVALARAHLETALLLDDRPLPQVGNRYFLALCDWAQGRKPQARQTWKELIPMADEEWTAILRKTLDLAERGHPEMAIFSDPSSEASTRK